MIDFEIGWWNSANKHVPLPRADMKNASNNHKNKETKHDSHKSIINIHLFETPNWSFFVNSNVDMNNIIPLD